MLYTIITRLTSYQKQVLFVIVDGLCIPFAYVAALLLVSQPQTSDLNLSHALLIMAIIAIGLVINVIFDIPRIRLNAYETRGLILTANFALTTSICGAALNRSWDTGLSDAAFITMSLVLTVLCAFWRILALHLILYIYRRNQQRMRIIIYGASQPGQQLAMALRQDENIHPIGFVDQDPSLQSMMIAGLRVFAPERLADLVQERSVNRIVLAMPSLTLAEQARLSHKLRSVGCPVHALPSFAEMIQNGTIDRSRAIPASEYFLGRQKFGEDLPVVQESYKGKRILITGAGGSIGSELCKQILKHGPAVLVLFDHSELALYQIDRALSAENSDALKASRIIPVLGSVLDEALTAKLLRDHDIQIVIHAAAYKHVPLVEENPVVGLSNNVLGTKQIADASRETGVERFILVSSDKAVRPTNVMGASKRLSELVVQDLAKRPGNTMFSMVRFGNVLGSSGSIIPLFQEQIQQGGPVTLTDNLTTRYLMTISEAASLVLVAGSFSRGGDVFVLNMGQPVAIKTLIRQMIEGAGFTERTLDNPDGDIEIKITGLRKGEKLHEELLIAPDMLTTPHSKIMRAKENCLSEIEIATAIKDLRTALRDNDESAARAVVARWVEGGQIILKPAKEG